MWIFHKVYEALGYHREGKEILREWKGGSYWSGLTSECIIYSLSSHNLLNNNNYQIPPTTSTRQLLTE